MLNLQARQVTELNHLLGDRKRARDQGLRCDHRGHGGQTYERHQRPIRRHHEKRVLHRRRVVQQQGTLAKVVERERRHDDGEPGDANRLLAEMTHVGVKRLAPCDAQHNSAQNDEGDVGVIPDESDCVMRAQGPQDFGMGQDLRHTQHRDAEKPDHRNRPKELANARGAALLHKEQAEQDDQRQWNHILLEGGRYHFQAFDCRQHGDRRRNNTIAVKQAGAEDANQKQHLTQARFVLDRLRGQRQHGHQAALTVVVGTQDERDVLDRDDNRQGPEENRQDAKHVFMGEGNMAGAEYFLDRVQNAGADVAVDNADGAQSERRKRRLRCCPAHS